MTDTSDPVLRAPRERIVVAGASAGGVEALVGLVRTLPAAFPYPLLVVLHVSPTGTSVLPSILARACSLPVASPFDGEPILPGHVYVAPPDSHLIVEDALLRLSQAPRENGHRPAIDPTMRSAAAAFDDRTIGIVLSGSRDDGTAGLMAIKAAGGLAVVQDPDEALYPAMPRSAMEHVTVDAVLPIATMGAWILEKDPTRVPAAPAPMSAGSSLMSSPSEDVEDLDAGEIREASGDGTRYTCPDCGGGLFERKEGALERFECSVGHAFSIESLSSAQAEALENALWAAVRSLEDRASMLRRLADRAQSGGHAATVARFERQAADALDRAATIRDAILSTTEPEAAA